MAEKTSLELVLGHDEKFIYIRFESAVLAQEMRLPISECVKVMSDIKNSVRKYVNETIKREQGTSTSSNTSIKE